MEEKTRPMALVAKDDSDLARLGGVTPAHMTQIMGMLNLAPDIQEALLFLPLIAKGRDPIPERVVWKICGEKDWRRQRKRSPTTQAMRARNY